jgi:HEAT repeat protein
MKINQEDRRFGIALSTLTLLLVSFACYGADAEYYAEQQIYSARPDPNREMPFGHIGVTGVMVRVYRGVTVKVEKTVPDSPADGKFKKGEIITGINGVSLEGKNPFVTLGSALTNAEATNGQMIFDVTSADGRSQRKETVRIPVLGSYSKTWPLDCQKSQQIIKRAAETFADRNKFGTMYNQRGIPAALACLFLLSTGDDQYLPPVKAYFDSFPKDVQRIGDHTWNNGYNGIACGEYYLRTGDKTVLPIMQYYCDDAKLRQKYGCGWVHWGTSVSPGYVAGGLMNPAGAQVLTTLLLGKECGVQVDDDTLLGSLRFFCRFAGRGTVPYGDHRGEGGLGSNGKDGMIAAAMQIAAGSQGDVTIYEMARQYLGMSMVTSYPVLVKGHGDEGRGDGIWRSIITAYTLRDRPDQYREAMDRLTWWHDLSREPGGSIGIATLTWQNGVIGSSGPGVGLSYTAPLKTLRITGAPRTKYSRDYTLPANIWGTQADRAFLSIDHNPKYYDHGGDEPTHIPFYALGGAYHRPEKKLESVPREVMLKNVYHRRYVIRAQAAKALRAVEEFEELEKLLRDPDPRVRRAGLDGLIDYNYWFAIGRKPISAEEFSPAMLKAIKNMLSDPKESWWVVDGALMALKLAPAEDIQACKSLIMPWSKHSDWWLRESSFMALSGLEKDDALYTEILPTLLTMVTDEYHTQPRSRMLGHLKDALKSKKRTSPAGKLILAGLKSAVKTSDIKPGIRSPEGAYNVFEVAKACLQDDPATAVAVALMIRDRFRLFATDSLIKLVATPNSNRDGKPYGLYTTLEQQSHQQREELVDILFKEYRQELINRMTAEHAAMNQPLVDTIIDLTKLRRPVAGWQPVGTPGLEDRIWRFRSFDPQLEKDQLHPREKKRFRSIQLPNELKGWYEVDYDDGRWEKGRSPIGVGVHKARGVSFENNSDWGRGEFVAMRTAFEMDAVDCDSYRLSILAKQGFNVYLNGHKIHTYIWWKDMPHYRPIVLQANHIKHLKKGTNVLAAYGNVEYDKESHRPAGQMDLFIEGLKMSDLE